MAAVVLLHSSGASHRMWRAQQEALGQDHEVFAPDLPGHGDSPGPFTFSRAVSVVGGILDRAGSPAYLVGLSVSATVAVLTCLTYPQQVSGLVLSGGIAHPPLLIWPQRAVTALLPEAAMASVTSRMLANVQGDYREVMVADLRAAGKPTVMAGLRELTRTDLRPRLPEVTSPALVLCGARDKANIRGSRELAAGIPSARLRIVPDAGHLWNLEQPELFTRTVREFIEGAQHVSDDT